MQNDKKSKQSTQKTSKNSTNKANASNQTQTTQPSDVAVKKRGVAKTIALVVILTLVALAGFLLIRYFADKTNPPQATLQGETVVRIGQSQMLTFDSTEVKQGQMVCWYVNGKRVFCQKYQGSPVQYLYNPTRVGVDHVRVDVGGKTYKWLNISVGNRLATVVVPNYVITYGDSLPQFDFTVYGVKKDSISTARAYVEGEPTEVGIYPVRFEYEKCDNCDLAVTEGKLEIIPRKLTVSNKFSKVYDGTETFAVDELQLDGILDGDDVFCKNALGYTDDKTVGTNKQIVLPNLDLQGNDAQNYYVDTQGLVGEITPKTLTIQGLKISTKTYDGTTKATFESVGKLVGVVKGDLVALGNCTATFEDSKVGKNKKVTLSNVCLVGRDKNNYQLQCDDCCTGSIEKKYVDLLLNTPEVVPGQNNKVRSKGNKKRVTASSHSFFLY